MVGELFAYLRELNLASLLVRLLAAMLFGGLIGMDRERKQRAAGFRTYMLVCLGAALTMILGEYNRLLLNRELALLGTELAKGTADVSRIGAQVINGIGFLGAGTIIVTERQRVKGVTTAAGLWASACMGLAIGAGFYECVFWGFLLIFIAIKLLPQLEAYVVANARHMNLFVSFERMEDMHDVVNCIKAQDIQIFEVEITRGVEAKLRHPSAVFTVCLPRRQPHTQVMTALSGLENVHTIEEI